jgi:NADPH:quinone reductase-like Zn-dependent oxidoreductase
MDAPKLHTTQAPPTMQAIRLHPPGTIADLVLESIPTPRLGNGEALVEVHAAAITRDELTWPVERLPAIPSYELSGLVVSVAPGVHTVYVGDSVFALTGFDRDGVAAGYAAVSGDLLGPKPRALEHVEAAALPLAALSAWQGLFDHGRLESGQRVLIHGCTGGVGHLATQLAHRVGAYVIGSASSAGAETAHRFGADEIVDGAELALEERLDPVDLVFDTVGGEVLARSPALVRGGGRLVSVAEEPPGAAGVSTAYFVVEPNREQLLEIARLADEGELRPAIDSVFALADAPAAFARAQASGKRGKVVLRVANEVGDA